MISNAIRNLFQVVLRDLFAIHLGINQDYLIKWALHNRNSQLEALSLTNSRKQERAMIRHVDTSSSRSGAGWPLVLTSRLSENMLAQNFNAASTYNKKLLLVDLLVNKIFCQIWINFKTKFAIRNLESNCSFWNMFIFNKITSYKVIS